MTGLDRERLGMLLDLDPGDTTYLDRAIGNFERNSVAAMTATREHLDDHDLPAARAVVHKIAGSALNLGAHEAGALAQQLEIACADDDETAARAQLPVLEAAMAQAREALLDYQRAYRGEP